MHPITEYYFKKQANLFETKTDDMWSWDRDKLIERGNIDFGSLEGAKETMKNLYRRSQMANSIVENPDTFSSFLKEKRLENPTLDRVTQSVDDNKGSIVAGIGALALLNKLRKGKLK